MQPGQIEPIFMELPCTKKRKEEYDIILAFFGILWGAIREAQRGRNYQDQTLTLPQMSLVCG